MSDVYSPPQPRPAKPEDLEPAEYSRISPQQRVERATQILEGKGTINDLLRWNDSAWRLPHSIHDAAVRFSDKLLEELEEQNDEFATYKHYSRLPVTQDITQAREKLIDETADTIWCSVALAQASGASLFGADFDISTPIADFDFWIERAETVDDGGEPGLLLLPYEIGTKSSEEQRLENFDNALKLAAISSSAHAKHAIDDIFGSEAYFRGFPNQPVQYEVSDEQAEYVRHQLQSVLAVSFRRLQLWLPNVTPAAVVVHLVGKIEQRIVDDAIDNKENRE